MEPLLQFEEVSKSFWTGRGRKVILHHASFQIMPGRSLGILAPNGTGKTTLINMMAGLEKPDEGVIRRNARISFPLGFLGGINPRHTGTENARYIARLYQLDPDEVEAFCRWLSEIGPYFDMPVATYSQGMKARFSFSLMLALQFDLYLVDEGMPATTDVRFNRRAGVILKERLDHATVVIVSHDMRVLEKYVDEAAVLRDGKLHFFDTLEEARYVYEQSLRQAPA